MGDTVEDDSIYRLTYDGQVADEHGFAVMGGVTEQATTFLREHYRAGTGLEDTVRLAVQALGQGSTETRAIPSGNLEVAVLDRTRSQQRKFKRLAAARLGEILGNGTGNGNGAATEAADADAGPAADADVPPLDPPVAPPVS